jgi:hypothetical protein
MRVRRLIGVLTPIVILTITGCSNESSGTNQRPAQGPTITATAGPGGTIVPSGAVAVAAGTNQAFAIAPSAGGYTLADVVVDGVSQGAITAYTFTNVTSAHTIAATFHAPLTITATAGAGGSIAPSGAVVVPRGGSQTFTITPDAGGYTLADVVVDGVPQGAVATVTFTDVTSNHTVAASFNAPLTITATAGAGGSISPSGAVVVPLGADQGFTVTANGGFVIADVVVDGVSQGPIADFTFSGVTAAHSIAATFTALPTAVVVKLVTQGTLPGGTLIGGVQATLTYATDKGLSIQSGNVVASGAGASSLLVANANTAGQLTIALVNATGIGTGEFATATFAVASGSFPVAADFAVAPGATVIDVNGAAIGGVTVALAPPDIL